MRNFQAFLLLMAFAAAQYGRQVSYLECQLFNYLQAPSVKCDCEKILKDKTAAEQAPLPASHNHLHIDESYFSPQGRLDITASYSCIISIDAGFASQLSEGIFPSHDQPPQVYCC